MAHRLAHIFVGVDENDTQISREPLGNLGVTLINPPSCVQAYAESLLGTTARRTPKMNSGPQKGRRKAEHRGRRHRENLQHARRAASFDAV